MATAALAQDLGSTAPYGPMQGARGQVWRCRDGWFACFGGKMRPPQKNREEHGALALGGHHLAATHNNQPIDSGIGRWDVGEEVRGG
jgi:hypothetical protein